jgi:hypothetical protein
LAEGESSLKLANPYLEPVKPAGANPVSLFGFIGKVAKAGLGVVTGGVSTAVLDAAGTIISPGSPKTQPTYNVMPGTGTSITSVLKSVSSGRGIVAQSPSIFPTSLPTPDSIKVTGKGVISPIGTVGSAGATAYYSPQGQPAGATEKCAIQGYHLNKSRYAVVNGGDPYVVEAGTKCVKNRRRNALNPRALNRAVSRVAAAKKYAKMLDRIEIKGRRRCR